MFWSSPSGTSPSFPPSTQESETSAPHSTEGSSDFLSSIVLLFFSSSRSSKLTVSQDKCKTNAISASGSIMSSRNNNNNRNQHKTRQSHRSCYYNQNQNSQHRRRHQSRTCDFDKMSDSNSNCDLVKRRTAVCAAVGMIMVLSVSVYYNCLDGDFVHDDVVSIVRNPDVRPNSISGWWMLWWNDYWGTPMSSPLSHKSYRPLTVLTFR